MLKIALNKNGPETEKDILRFAKKSGYTAKKVDENTVWITYDLTKNKVGAPSKKIPKDIETCRKRCWR